MSQNSQPKLRLIPGGLSQDPRVNGPITRKDLWSNFQALSGWQLALIFVPKLLLLASLFYFIFV